MTWDHMLSSVWTVNTDLDTGDTDHGTLVSSLSLLHHITLVSLHVVSRRARLNTSEEQHDIEAVILTSDLINCFFVFSIKSRQCCSESWELELETNVERHNNDWMTYLVTLTTRRCL